MVPLLQPHRLHVWRQQPWPHPTIAVAERGRVHRPQKARGIDEMKGSQFHRKILYHTNIHIYIYTEREVGREREIPSEHAEPRIFLVHHP